MVVTESGLAGTIGGGALEHQAIGAGARDPRARRRGAGACRIIRSGRCSANAAAGGSGCMVEQLDERSRRRRARSTVTLGDDGPTASAGAGRRAARSARGPLPAAGARFVEPAETDLLPVTMFGAGHVGRAIAARAPGLPLHFAWHDSRPEAAETPGVVLADEDAMVACAAGGARRRGGGDPHPRSRARLSPHRRRARQPRALRRADRLAGPSARASCRGSRPTASTRARLTCPIGLPGITRQGARGHRDRHARATAHAEEPAMKAFRGEILSVPDDPAVARRRRDPPFRGRPARGGGRPRPRLRPLCRPRRTFADVEPNGSTA